LDLYFDYSIEFGKTEAHLFFMKNYPWSSDQLNISLIKSISRNQTAIAKNLIGFGVDPNGGGGAWTYHAMRRNQREMVKVLLEGGARPERNVLEIAALNGDVEIVELLVAKGADIREAAAYFARSQKTPQNSPGASPRPRPPIRPPPRRRDALRSGSSRPLRPAQAR
jgi:hypothetical protein